jgi:hypothetical protein
LVLVEKFSKTFRSRGHFIASFWGLPRQCLLCWSTINQTYKVRSTWGSIISWWWDASSITWKIQLKCQSTDKQQHITNWYDEYS